MDSRKSQGSPNIPKLIHPVISTKFPIIKEFSIKSREGGGRVSSRFNKKND